MSWRPERDEPDVDMIVLVYVPTVDSDPVWLGYMDGDCIWRYSTGSRIEPPPTHWMELPEVPE